MSDSRDGNDPNDPNDPKGLIREAYRIDGITAPECRSILIDWALSLPLGADPRRAIAALLATHATGADPGHPMTAELRAGLPPAPPPRRRGGRAGRLA